MIGSRPQGLGQCWGRTGGQETSAATSGQQHAMSSDQWQAVNRRPMVDGQQKAVDTRWPLAIGVGRRSAGGSNGATDYPRLKYNEVQQTRERAMCAASI